MPNFPLPIGRGANAALRDRIASDTVPKFPFAPDMQWTTKMDWKTLGLRSSTQSATVLINSSTDGDHVLTFSGGGLAAPVAITVTASTNTAAQIAAALEAAIQSARATTLAGVVTNETVSTATITITFLTKSSSVAPVTITPTVPGGSAPTITYSYVATVGTSGFPTNVVRDTCVLNRKVAFVGPTTFTVEVGDSGASTGLLTATSVLTTGYVNTIAAAEATPRFESAFAPQLVFRASAATPLSLQSLTAGELEVVISYYPPVTPTAT